MPAPISPEMMKLVGGAGGPPPGAPPGTPPGAPQAAPVASPMSTPQPKDGEREGAFVQIQMAMDLIEKTLPALGSETDEGGAAIAALQQLRKAFGDKRDKARDMMPAEIQSLQALLPKAPGGPPPGGMPPGGAPSPHPPM